MNGHEQHQRTEAGRPQRRDDRDRMDQALIENAEDQVDDEERRDRRGFNPLPQEFRFDIPMCAQPMKSRPSSTRRGQLIYNVTAPYIPFGLEIGATPAKSLAAELHDQHICRDLDEVGDAISEYPRRCRTPWSCP